MHTDFKKLLLPIYQLKFILHDEVLLSSNWSKNMCMIYELFVSNLIWKKLRMNEMYLVSTRIQVFNSSNLYMIEFSLILFLSVETLEYILEWQSTTLQKTCLHCKCDNQHTRYILLWLHFLSIIKLVYCINILLVSVKQIKRALEPYDDVFFFCMNRSIFIWSQL